MSTAHQADPRPALDRECPGFRQRYGQRIRDHLGPTVVIESSYSPRPSSSKIGMKVNDPFTGSRSIRVPDCNLNEGGIAVDAAVDFVISELQRFAWFPPGEQPPELARPDFAALGLEFDGSTTISLPA